MVIAFHKFHNCLICLFVAFKFPTLRTLILQYSMESFDMGIFVRCLARDSFMFYDNFCTFILKLMADELRTII